MRRDKAYDYIDQLRDLRIQQEVENKKLIAQLKSIDKNAHEERIKDMVTIRNFIEGWENESPEGLENLMRNLQRILYQITKETE